MNFNEFFFGLSKLGLTEVVHPLLMHGAEVRSKNVNGETAKV
jgi:hypothetical protein